MSSFVDPLHFDDTGGVLVPQPWMQWRQVASVGAVSKSGSYSVTGGVNKNDLLHSIQTAWKNETPIDQWVYGLVTRGGSQLTLQARSRAYLSLKHSGQTPDGVIPVVEASRVGIGADIGKSGLLSIGTGFCVMEHRQQSVTMPLFPNQAGWYRLVPGGTFSAAVELRFVSELWESTTIDGGSSGTESSFITGDTRLDLFAVPVI